MDTSEIDNINHPFYKKFEQLYTTSFPIFEQRTTKQQIWAFNHEKYHLIYYHDDMNFIGFIAYWDFDTYYYVEHFAINTTLRDQGYGSTILNSFIQSTNKIILLEIDPIVDEITGKRLKFYQNCGFYTNPHPHKHPPYRKEYQAHSLIILTTKHLLTTEEYQKFYANLIEIMA